MKCGIDVPEKVRKADTGKTLEFKCSARFPQKYRVFPKYFPGLVCSQGQDWIEQRKFTMRHLREFGFGKLSMESLIQEEVEELIEGLR